MTSAATIRQHARTVPATALIFAVALALSIPVLVIVWSIVQPSTEVWRELWDTRLPGHDP